MPSLPSTDPPVDARAAQTARLVDAALDLARADADTDMRSVEWKATMQRAMDALQAAAAPFLAADGEGT